MQTVIADATGAQAAGQPPLCHTRTRPMVTLLIFITTALLSIAVTHAALRAALIVGTAIEVAATASADIPRNAFHMATDQERPR